VTTETQLSRRRVLTILAASGLSLAGLSLGPGALRAGGPETPLVRWEGDVLGTRACIILAHPEPAVARRMVEVCLAEIDRLDRVFSLYRADSELARLNRDGRLEGPSQDFLCVLGASQAFGALSEGAFDVSVQPLWRLYADHFAAQGPSGPGPDPGAIRSVLGRVDFRAIDASARRVRLGRPGMALTLNGIAQGYIADRIAELLRVAGVEHVLLDLGETRAVGGRPDGVPWQVAIRDPLAPSRDIAVWPLCNQAVASSGAYGYVFDDLGRYHHLFDPRTGCSAHDLAGVTVSAADALTADVLATALAVAGPKSAPALLRAVPGTHALLVLPDGAQQTLPAGVSPRES